MDELRRLVPPPAPQLLGGERIDASCYVRFLSVCNWEIPRAEEMLSSDLKWRRKYQPRKLRPSDMQIMCRQNAWQVMMKEGGRFGMGGLNVGGNDENAGSGKRKSSNGRSRDGSRSGIRNGARLGRSKEKKDGGSGAGSSDRGESPPSSSGGDKRSSVDDRAGGSGTDDDNFFLAFREQWTRPPLQPPHVKPPLAQWRHTKQGMPLTFLEVANWHPELAGHDERVRHVAYHMEHYIRRMPSRRGGKSKRCAIIMDLRGFKATMLPYVKECVDVLRLHYPGRLGAACFINVPAYFYPVRRQVLFVHRLQPPFVAASSLLTGLCPLSSHLPSLPPSCVLTMRSMLPLASLGRSGRSSRLG